MVDMIFYECDGAVPITVEYDRAEFVTIYRESFVDMGPDT